MKLIVKWCVVLGTVFLVGWQSYQFSQSVTVASSRATATLAVHKQRQTMTKPVIVLPRHSLHVIITAYSSELTSSNQSFSYQLYRNGHLYKTLRATHGHTVEVLHVKSGAYTLKIKDGHQLIFTGGLSVDKDPHFI